MMKKHISILLSALLIVSSGFTTIYAEGEPSPSQQSKQLSNQNLRKRLKFQQMMLKQKNQIQMLKWVTNLLVKMNLKR